MEKLAPSSCIAGRMFSFERIVPSAGNTGDMVLCRDTEGIEYAAALDEWRAGAAVPPSCSAQVTHLSSTREKIALFRSLFRGRESAYATGYMKKDGKIGYGPVCANLWKPGVCRKGRMNKACDGCPGRKLVPLDDKALIRHFRGKDARFRDVAGLYPMTEKSGCFLLVADFDDEGWQEAVSAYRTSCMSMGLSCSVERSRSGAGAHVWIFFEEELPAAKARQLGILILDDARRSCSHIGFASYDRLFPTQDTLSKDGLGNLIALPLQGAAVVQGNSVFVDESFCPYPDQWAYLSCVKQASAEDVEQLLQKQTESSRLPSSGSISCGLPLSGGSLSGKEIEVHLKGMVEISRACLPQPVVADLERMAALANPEFFIKQRMHERIWNTPRFLWFGAEDDKTVSLPRGCLAEAIGYLKLQGAKPVLVDERQKGRALHVCFRGELRPGQNEAFAALKEHEDGMLVAPTAFGKTVIASRLIAERGVSTLVLVPASPLLEQWKASLDAFLEIRDTPDVLLTPTGRKRKHQPDTVGLIGGGRLLPSGLVDIALVQSLTEKGEVKGDRQIRSLVRNYGMIVVDEAQHVPASSLIEVLKQSNATYLLGLTATPKRQDRLDKAITFFMGPVRYTASVKEQMAGQGMARRLVPRFTGVQPPERTAPADWQGILKYLGAHEGRNALIVDDVCKAAEAGRCPLVLTRLVDHAERLSDALEKRLGPHSVRVFMLVGADDAKTRKRKLLELARLPQDAQFCIVATDKYLGEGFDEPRLDALFLAAPISWSGLVTQDVGRIHRTHEGKHEVEVHDYVDEAIPLCCRQWKSRLKTYAKLGYTLAEAHDGTPAGHIVQAAESRKLMAEDIGAARSSLFIASGWLQKKACTALYPLLEDARHRGVKVSVQVSEAAAESNGDILERFRTLGIGVICSSQKPAHALVCDGSLVWFGGISPLAFPEKDDCSIRLTNAELAAELEGRASP